MTGQPIAVKGAADERRRVAGWAIELTNELD
jgi:hypothetical protein